MNKDQIRAIFMANGFTIKEGQTDLKDYVYAAAEALLAASASAEPVCATAEIARKSLYYLDGNLPDGPTDQAEFEQHKALLRVLATQASPAAPSSAENRPAQDDVRVWKSAYEAEHKRVERLEAILVRELGLAKAQAAIASQSAKEPK